MNHLTPSAFDPAAGSLSIPGELPTTPCSVVWSGGHAYVLEYVVGRSRWVGMDERGRAVALRPDDLRRRGWTRRPTNNASPKRG